MHLLPMFGRSRQRLRRSLGEKGYRISFSVISLIGLVLIVWGFARAPFEPVYAPFPWARPLAIVVLPFAFILLAAANMPTHIRSALRHPMLIGVLLWAIVHLLNNGDLRSILLFGSFAAWAAVDMVSEIRRGRTLIGNKPPRWSMDLAAAAGGLVVSGLLARFHDTLFGVPVLPLS
jgi:uncharacterized membrane protein